MSASLYNEWWSKMWWHENVHYRYCQIPRLFVCCDERGASGDPTQNGLGATAANIRDHLHKKKRRRTTRIQDLHAFFDETTSDREFFASENISTIEDRSILYQTLSLPKNTCSLFYPLDSCSICDTKWRTALFYLLSFVSVLKQNLRTVSWCSSSSYFESEEHCDYVKRRVFFILSNSFWHRSGVFVSTSLHRVVLR